MRWRYNNKDYVGRFYGGSEQKEHKFDLSAVPGIAPASLAQNLPIRSIAGLDDQIPECLLYDFIFTI